MTLSNISYLNQMQAQSILQFLQSQVTSIHTQQLAKNLRIHFNSDNSIYRIIMLSIQTYIFLCPTVLQFYPFFLLFHALTFIFCPFVIFQYDFYKTQLFITIMKILLKIKYLISLSFIKNNFNRQRDMIVHHGLMGSSKNFSSICKNTQISNYVNSYLIDCRNHGNSPHTSTHSIQDLADDLYQFIKQHNLSRKNKLTLMGHSMGGMALMKFTQRYPEIQGSINRVILIDIFCFSQESSKINTSSTGNMLQNMRKINLNQSTKMVFHQIQKRASSKDVAGLLKSNIKIINQSEHRWIPNLETILNYYSHLNNFQLKQNNWRKPIEVIYGSKSNYVNKHQIKKYCQLYPQMKEQENFHKVEEAGHWVHFENTPAFLNQMNIILKKDETDI